MSEAESEAGRRMKLKIDIDEDYYKIICKRVEKNKPYHSPYEYEVIADGKPIEQEPTDKNFTKADIDAIVKAINAHWELIIDEIRAEIRKKMKFNSFNEGYVLYDDIIEVLDKYKADTENT